MCNEIWHSKISVKPIKRYSEGHRDDCVHLGDAGNVLLQDMVGGLVEHISDQNINFDLDDLMNQTVRLKVREGCQNVPLWL